MDLPSWQTPTPTVRNLGFWDHRPPPASPARVTQLSSACSGQNHPPLIPEVTRLSLSGLTVAAIMDPGTIPLSQKAGHLLYSSVAFSTMSSVS